MSDVFKLRDLVYEETGMYFPDEKRYYFESRFQRRMEAMGHTSFLQYYQFLKIGNGRREELYKLMSELTINETSFFRNAAHFTVFQNLVVPEIVKMKEGQMVKRLRIWSAGCSSGEEPYTLAMILNEMRKGILKGWTFEIHATDISDSILEIAKKAVYLDNAVKNMPEYYRDKYFVHTDHTWSVVDMVKRDVRFSNLNLSDDMAMVFQKGFDVILCKNVLIYFSLDSKKRVLQHFFNNLNSGGYLFVGFSESLFGIANRFSLIRFPGGMMYRKMVHV